MLQKSMTTTIYTSNLPRNRLGKPLRPKLSAMFGPRRLDDQVCVLIPTLFSGDGTGDLFRLESHFPGGLSCHISVDGACIQRKGLVT